MAALTSYNYTTDYAEFAISSAAELPKLPNTSRGGTDELAGLNHPIKGGLAYTTGGELEIYTLGGDDNWNKREIGGGGGGGESWITDIPENHKNIYRGKYLGNSVSAAQLAAIADGSFDDLYVGDYWTIPVTIDNVEQSVKWRIADIDYFIGYRDAVDTTKRMTAHHLVIVPDTSLYLSQPGGRSNGYNGSGIRTSGLDKAKTAINAVFPDMVLTHKNYISTAIDSNGNVARTEEQTCTVELMNEVMVFGFNRFQQPANQEGNVYYSLGGQFALFSLCPKWKSHNAEEPIIPTSGAVSYLLQDPCYTSYQQYWTGAWTIEIGPLNYTNNGGVRPYFIIGTR